MLKYVNNTILDMVSCLQYKWQSRFNIHILFKLVNLFDSYDDLSNIRYLIFFKNKNRLILIFAFDLYDEYILVAKPYKSKHFEDT